MQYQKRKGARLFTGLVCLALAAGMTGCSDIADTTSSLPAGTTAAQAAEETTETTLERTEESVNSMQETAPADAATSGTALTVEERTSEEAASGGELVGDTGLTAEAWCTQAQQIYENAASTYFIYQASSGMGFTYDTSDTIGDGSWQRVTNYSTIEEAEAGYYEVFAQAGHETDLDAQFQMSDGKLYRLCGDRGSDISYQSSAVTALTGSTADTLTFSVVSSYQFPDETEATQKESVLTLVYERGAWRVGTFTMPY